MQSRASSGRALLAVTVGYFLIMFAVSPVSVILPALSETLRIDVGPASWVMTAYLLPLTACLLPAGRLGDLAGHRRVFTIGLALAAVSAGAAGLAPSFPLLLAARALQGVSAALVSASSLPLITSAVDSTRRGRAIGLATMAYSLGAMTGTGIAPLMLRYLTWHWVFYAGAIGGVVALALALRYGGERQNHDTREAGLGGGGAIAADADGGVALAEPLPRWAGNVYGWLALAHPDARSRADAAGHVRLCGATRAGAADPSGPIAE